MKRGHKSPIPAWAMSDGKAANVVATYLERRAGIRKADGSSAERIRRSEDGLWAQLPALERRMKNLIAECRATYALLENGVRQLPSYHPDLRCRMAELEKAVRCLDTEISFIRRGAASFLVGVLYWRYRMPLNSMDIAEEFETTPAHVRQTLSKLNQVGGALYGREICSVKETGGRKFVSFSKYEELSENSGIPFTLAA